MKTKRYILPFILLLSSLAYSGDQKMKIDALVNPKVVSKTITVGGADADISGFTSQAIQKALDALQLHGGGTVQLNKGIYEIIAPVRLYSNTTLIGQGAETILRKVDGLRTNFIIDADYGELFLTVADPTGFIPGMAVQIFDAEQSGGWAVTTAVITAIEGNKVYIDNHLVRDYRSDHDGIVSNACSIVSAVEAEHVRIANLTIDGNKDNNDIINGCRAGGVYLHKVKNALVENVLVRDFNGDGISWQITEDVTVRDCEVTTCSSTGLHPGTGSPNSIVEGNNAHHNQRDGLFICWRVQHGVVRDNKFHHNNRFGLCTGHKDTDMLFEGNHIFENGSDGIHLRGERESNAPHRNIFRKNIIENNGVKEEGYGFSTNCPAKDVLLEENIIRNTEAGKQKAAIYIYQNGLPVTLRSNEISGHDSEDVLYEKK